MKSHASQRGSSVIEVLIALAMAGIIVVSIGKVLTTVHSRDLNTALQERGIAHAKESLEILSSIQNTSFACTCSTDSCASSVCTKSSDGQTCALAGLYTSCWTTYPDGLTSLTPLHLVHTGTEWVLADGAEQIPADPLFTRTITIINVLRGSNGDIVESGGTVDPSTKKITTQVSWLDRNGQQKDIELSTLLTGWQNL